MYEYVARHAHSLIPSMMTGTATGARQCQRLCELTYGVCTTLPPPHWILGCNKDQPQNGYVAYNRTMNQSFHMHGHAVTRRD